MRLDLAQEEGRVELGFNCDDEAQAVALFERLKAMLEAGLIVLQLSGAGGDPITLESEA